jgi:threonine/homoserine/homoserine lactone efflux protein
MPSLETLAVFAVAAVGFLLLPGPAVTFVVVRSIDRGRAVGPSSVAGLELGTMFHVVAAAFGVSAIVASSAVAFSVLKYLGAVYLIAIGIRTWLRAEDPGTRASRDVETAASRSELWRGFRDGVIVNVLNPKTALFFLAFLPQFVDPARGGAATQLLVLGTMLVLIALCTDGAYALLASRLGRWLRDRPSFARRRRIVTGGVYVTLGVAAAVSGGTRARSAVAARA